MHIQALRIRNFRRLKNVLIDLAKDVSIFVGSNNSGKTSAVHGLQLFANGSRDRFSIHDFCAEAWAAIDAFGEGAADTPLPQMSLDLWFHVEAADLHRVVDLLPSLSWQGSVVGIRIEFAAADEVGLLDRYRAAQAKTQESAGATKDANKGYQPSPRTLSEYLADHLGREYELQYYVVDRAQFDDALVEVDGYAPLELTPDKARSGKELLGSLLRVDFLSAQRHLSDGASGSRAEDLSRCLSRFYKRNLEKQVDDHDAMRALAESEAMLNDHLARVFEPTLRHLSNLGYPGLNNPRLLIKSALNPASIMSSNDGTKVHYALADLAGAQGPTLPDQYNGLGFRNLIYMVVELLAFHAQWMDIEENRPPLHLVFVEEPEAHLHAQLQQVFVRKIMDLVALEADEAADCASQIVITTHSPHILYERGFQPIRYFRRSGSAVQQSTEVLNLSKFYESAEASLRDFLQRYLKLTHCDLFFADAAVLVEGNVERLLLPQMIPMVAPRLSAAYLSILEIGGAFGHRFRSLVEFLGITTLIVTDIDSVTGEPSTESVNEQGEEQAEASDADIEEAAEEADDANVDDNATAGKTCMVHEPNAVTSNQTLIQWLPCLTAVSDLLGATPEQKVQPRTDDTRALIRVAYQTSVTATWRGETKTLTGRTLEEALALENLAWSQENDRAELGLKVRGNAQLVLDELFALLHKKIKSSSFNKTDFALALLAQPPEWTVPAYIREGLEWLEAEVTPIPVEAPATNKPAKIAA